MGDMDLRPAAWAGNGQRDRQGWRERKDTPSTRLVPVTTEVEDEALEAIWLLHEQGSDLAAELVARPDWPGGEAMLAGLQAAGLVELAGDKISFTPTGQARAREIIRRHRLAERLLVDLFDLEEETVEASACQFEHILSPEVTDSVCTLLGHPPHCPHGRPIPRGECCARHLTHVQPIILPLTELPAGAKARIVFVAPRAYAQLDRLSTLGLLPGNVVWLRQKRPAYVLQVGQTDLALDASIAQELFVKPV